MPLAPGDGEELEVCEVLRQHHPVRGMPDLGELRSEGAGLPGALPGEAMTLDRVAWALVWTLWAAGLGMFAYATWRDWGKR
jgi:hypothetical protein